jgi:hypothetical protein
LRKFVIFALAFAFSCENTDVRLCGCSVTFSDALPVQFWLADCETFNEKEVDGIFSKCFCQLFNSDDDITVQFRNTTGYSYILNAEDDDGLTLFSIPFTEVVSGVYQLTFSPIDHDVSEDDLQLKILDQSTVQLVKNASLWTDFTSSFDSKTSTSFVEAVTSATGTIQVSQPLIVPTGTTIYLKYRITISGTWTAASGIRLFLFLHDSGGSSVGTSINTTPTYNANGEYEFTAGIQSTATTATLHLRLQEQNVTSGTADVTIEIFPNTVLYSTDASVIAKSDCISIKEDHDETILINYHNNRQFASLNPSVGTPDPEFNLRLPAIFFDERFPQESEVIELSNSRSVQLSAQVKVQKQLKVQHMPYYMHKKAKLALAFQTVTIDNEEWIMQEAYEIEPGNPRHPLKKAAVWLTEKDAIYRNVL